MNNVRELMSDDHRHCDDFFVEIEREIGAADWEKAAAAFARFSEAMRCHFNAEEAVLFPAFEERSGLRMGPTQMMRSEHAQMVQLIEAAGAALAERDADDYSGFAETLLIMMQQHNMKEENVLYPMCDQHLFDQFETLLPQLHDGLYR